MRKYISKSYWLDKDIEEVLGNMLRFGVVLSAIITAIGGIIHLILSGSSKIPAFQQFRPASTADTHIRTILSGAAHFQSRSVLLLGILLLIATPVMRVFFSFFAFLLEKDYLYVVLTLVVLCIIGVGIVGGFA